MPIQRVEIRGLRQLQSALKRYDSSLLHELDKELRDAGQVVADSARDRFSSIDARSAAGFRPRVRGFGHVVVEQRRKRTTGLRGDFGSLQMRRALLPAVAENRQQVLDHVEGMLDRLGRENGF